jgi:uncharacterized membrane protein YqjE
MRITCRSEKLVQSQFRYPARVLRAVLLGLPGVAVLPFVHPVPDGIPAAALLINPAILLLLASLIGAWAAPRASLGSAAILGSGTHRRTLGLWLAAGIAGGVAVAVLDHSLAGAWDIGLPSLREGRDVSDLVLGLLYGGLTEEVLMRFGLMSLLALGLLQLLPRVTALWAAAALAAILFALGHLPAIVMETGGITPVLLLRTLLWNGLLGVAFGVAFFRDGLEAAIFAHMGAHIGFFLAAL